MAASGQAGCGLIDLQIVTYEVTLCRPLTAAFPRSVKRMDEYLTCIPHFYARISVEFYIFMRVKVLWRSSRV